MLAAIFIKNKRTSEIIDKMLISYKELKHHGKRHSSCTPSFATNWHTCMFKKVKILDITSENIKKVFWRNNTFSFSAMMDDYLIKGNKIEIYDQYYTTNDYDACVNYRTLSIDISIRLFDEKRNNEEKNNLFRLMYELGLELE